MRIFEQLFTCVCDYALYREYQWWLELIQCKLCCQKEVDGLENKQNLEIDNPKPDLTVSKIDTELYTVDNTNCTTEISKFGVISNKLTSELSHDDTMVE